VNEAAETIPSYDPTVARIRHAERRGLRLFAGEVPRGVAGRERASHTSNSSHGTELGEIASHACAAKRPEPSIVSHRSGSEHA